MSQVIKIIFIFSISKYYHYFVLVIYFIFLAGTGTIVLVHGYCANTNPFAENPTGTWSNAKFFLNAGYLK